MASSICFGSFLNFRSRDEILKAFLKLLKNSRFKNAIFKSNGNCNNVYDKEFLISTMSAELKISPFDYLKITKDYKIIQLQNPKNLENHFIMIYNFDNAGYAKIYDPSFDFFLENVVGTFSYYFYNGNKLYKEIRNYPFNPNR